MNTINLASLNVDTSKLVKSTAEIKADLDSLKQKQKELADHAKRYGSDVTEEQVKNEIAIKQLSKAYNDNMKVIVQNGQATKDLEKAEKLITSAINGEISTVNEARANIALLTRLRNDTNTTTEEGRKQVIALNNAIDANNDYIKENADELLKLKMNIGNYADSMKEAISELNVFNGGLMDFIKRSNESGGAGNALSATFTSLTAGLMGMVKAGLAFIATPIGATIAALAVAVGVVVGAFKFMVTQMSKTEEGSDKLAKVMAIFTGILNTVTQVLKPLAEFIFKTFVSALESAMEIGEKIITTYSKVARVLGFDGVADGIDNMVKKTKENIKSAQDLAQAEADLTEARRKGNAIQLEYQKQAEKLRQQRDDETNSIQKRMALNNQLGKTLKEQADAELKIANQALKVAQLRLKTQGASTENLDKEAEARKEIADIQERITGQESEQLANLNSLRKEASDKAKALREEQLAGYLAEQQALLEKFKAEMSARARDADEQIELLEKIKEQADKVAEAEYNASKKKASDKLKLENSLNANTMELLKARTELVISLADREVDIFRRSAEQQLNDGKIFNQELLNGKLQLLDEIANREAEANRLRLQEGIISQQAYNDEMNRIDDENLAQRKALLEANKQAEQAKQMEDLENQKIIQQDNFLAQAEIEKQQNAIKMQQEIDNAELTGANVDAIKQKYALAENQIDEAVAENKLNIASSTFGALASIAGENSKLGKALAIAQATIDTYKGAVSAYSAMSGIPVVGPALGAVAAGAVVVAGIANVKKIASTKTPKAKKGATIELGGNRHEAGGTTLFDGNGNAVIEAERNELIGVMNRNASSHFMSFNDAFNGSAGQTLSTSGGQINPTIRDNNSYSNNGDIIEAIKNMPAPVVSVEDINYKSSEYVKVTTNGDL